MWCCCFLFTRRRKCALFGDFRHYDHQSRGSVENIPNMSEHCKREIGFEFLFLIKKITSEVLSFHHEIAHPMPVPGSQSVSESA